MLPQSKKYSLVVVALLFSAALSSFAPRLYSYFNKSAEGVLIEVFFLVALIFLLSTAAFYSSKIMKLPSFVLAIVFGLAAKPFLGPIINYGEILSILVGLGATLILFGGGLETPLINFKRLFWKICSLSFVGLLLTAWLFSESIFYLCQWLGQPLSMTAAILLGALLASTDPAAIIPLLKKLRFKNRFVKDLVVSESAVTDVAGTLLTVVFLSLINKGVQFESVTSWYQSVFSIESGLILGRQILFGSLAGLLGYFLLRFLHGHKHQSGEEFEADSAFFLFVPVFIFAVALACGGSGYLAAFIAGLIFNLSEDLRATENFFNFLVEGFLKPTIFIFLGALVDIPNLMTYASAGLISAIIFMFLIRPLIVFISLGAWRFMGKDRLNFKDLIFISFIRETGAIPAVLLTTIIGLSLPNMAGLIEIGMWVILSTLIVEPIITPWIAKKLQVAEEMKDEKKFEVGHNQAVVVLGSRGHSFARRLPEVALWAATNISSREVILLLCLEDKYDQKEEHQINIITQDLFRNINESLIESGLKSVNFSFVSRHGLLQDNLSALAKEHGSQAVIFVGKRMLDYRLNEVKNLGAPIYFIE